MRRAILLLAALLLAAPSAIAAAAQRLDVDVARLEIQDVRLAGTLRALEVPSAPGRASLVLEAGDLVVENDWARGTYAGPAGVPTDSDQERHALGPATLSGRRTGDVPRLLVLPLGTPESLQALALRLEAQASTAPPAMEAYVPETVHGRLEADVAGATAWVLQDGSLELAGDFLLAAWGWDLAATTPRGQAAFPTGDLREPAVASAPDVGSFHAQQAYAVAREARLRLSFEGGAVAVAHLDVAQAAWDGSGRLEDARGDLPGTAAGALAVSEVELRPASLAGAQASGSRIRFALDREAWPGEPASQAAGLPRGGPGWAVAALPLLALALAVPGAGVPLLRRRHHHLLCAAEAAVSQGRLAHAADLARRLQGSRWFALDASAVGAEACLRAGDARQALAFLDAGPWVPAAQPLRSLLRARALALAGEASAAAENLRSALEGSPDLLAQARRDARLRRLLDGAPEAYA